MRLETLMLIPDTDLSGRIAIVTGANSGVGYEITRGLARRHCRVVMAQRDAGKGAAARESLLRELAQTGIEADLHVETLDLGDLASVADGADRLNALCPRLDYLINNAGLHDIHGGKTADGFDKTVGVNYVGPFLLTDHLLGTLLKTAASDGACRVVNVASMAHRFAIRFDADDPFPDPYPPAREAYSESKLANMLHARALARSHGDAGLRAYSAHPGFVASNFGREDHWPGAWRLAFTLTKPMQISPARGAEPPLFAALSPADALENGAYLTHRGLTRAHYRGDVGQMTEKLWQRTIEAIEAQGFVIHHP